MLKLADIVEQHAEELAIMESVDNGKPKKVAKETDVKMVSDVLRFYAGLIDKIHGKTVPVDGNFFAYTKK